MAKPNLIVHNTTGWTKASLRGLIRATMDAVGVRQMKIVDVVVPKRGGHSVSVPTYGDRQDEAKRFTLKIREPMANETPADSAALATSIARVVMWALMTCQGVRSRDMTDNQRHCCQDVSHITKGRTLKAKAVKAPKPAPEPAPVQPPPPKETPAERGARLRDARASHAATMLAQARKRIRKLEADMKRAKTIEARWAAKVRYYQRTEAAIFGEADRIEDELDDAADALNEAVSELKQR
jgi:hypothetical protein